MKKITIALSGLWLLFVTASGQVSLIPVQGYKAVPVLETFTSPGPFDLSGNILYAGFGDTIFGVDMNTGTAVKKFGKPEGYTSYASFITVSPGGDEIWAGFTVAGNTDDRIYRIDAISGEWTLEARFAGNFDLAFWNDTLLVSGLNSTSISDPNGIYILDTTGMDRHRRILVTGGYSAGLAVDDQGNLYYGTSLAMGPNALYRFDSVLIAWAMGPGNGTLEPDDGMKLTDLPAGAYDCSVDEAGNVLFNFNEFMADKVLARWNGTEGDGFRFDTLAVASGALDWLGMIRTLGNISEPSTGNRVLTVSLSPGHPLVDVHRDYIPVQLFPIMPLSGLEGSVDSTIDLSLYFTDPDDANAFSFEVTALSDPAITQANVNGQELTVGFLAPGQAKIVVKAMNAGTSLESDIIIGVQPVITGEYLVSGFGDLALEPESYWNGSDDSGSFVSGAVQFYNTYNPDWFVWNGWACSNTTDVTTPGFMNQYSAITGEGFDPGGSGNSNYGVSYVSPPSVIDFTEGKAHAVAGFMITNSTYAALSMEQGDAFSKKFGGADGTDPDFFRLLVWGRKEASSTDTMEYLLADYTSDSSLYDYIIKTWQWVDLTSLGKVDSLVFALESSDNSAWGMNTPAFFCMDELHVIPDMAPVVVNPIADITLFAVNGSDTVIDLTGVFDDPDDPGAEIEQSVKSVTNSALLGASIQGHALTITYASSWDNGGETDVVVEAVSGGLAVTDTFTITVVPLTGIQPGAAVSMDIFPNPGDGRFMIETGMGGSIKVEVYNLTGNKVYNQDQYVPGRMIDLGSPPAGGYLIRIRGNEGSVTRMIHVTGQQ